jgi:hypothetical protein
LKNIAIGILLIILLSIIIEPMVETANVLREKILLGSALNTSFRAAKDRSFIVSDDSGEIQYDSRRELDAIVDKNLFMQHFSEAFEDAMDLELSSVNGNELVFVCKKGKYNNFTVIIDINERTDSTTGQVVSEVIVTAESKYNFKTKYLKLAESSLSNDYMLKGERKFLLFVRN